MISADIVEILDLVDADDPVLAGKRLLNNIKGGALVWQPNASNSIRGLPGREEVVVVVV